MFWTWSCFIKSMYLFTVLSYLVDKSSHGLSWFVNITREDSISILSVSQLFILIVNKIPLVTYRFTRVSPEFWYVNNVKIRSISIPNPWFHTAFVLSFSKEFARDVTLILVQKADWKPTFYIKYWRFHGETYYYSVIYYDKISI